MEKWKKRSIDLLTSLAFGTDGTPSVVPYYPQKTRVSGDEERFFRRSTPERHGISSKRIYNMLVSLESEKRANIHNLVILAGGEIISECSRDGYGVNVAHLSHSMSKTVTGMIIGILHSDGLIDLDDAIVDIFPEIPYRDKRFANITVRHLLTMTSGVDFGEAGSITESKWTEAFFASSLRFAPGSKFAYNSMNSYILARVAERVSGKPFATLAGERFFDPLEIRNYLWEKSPEGTEKGGWGLYMSAESWAKVGYMFLSGGVFCERRILPREWVECSGRDGAQTGYVSGDFDYGYQIWYSREGEEYLFNGMLGQNVWICPKNDVVVVVMSGNNELFQDSPALEIIRRHLGGEINDELHRADYRVLRERETEFFDSRRWVRPREKKQGLFYWLGIRRRETFDVLWSRVLGEYRFGKNNDGMLPLVVRAMQNNLNSTLESLSLFRRNSELYLTFVESGVKHILPVGLYEPRGAVLDFRGEKYIVKCMGEAILIADGTAEYRIELIFPELPNTRMLKITAMNDDRIRLELFETPNNKIVENLLSRVASFSSVASVSMEIIERRFGDGIIARTLRRAFCPMLIGASADSPDCEKIVAEETLRRQNESRAVKLIRAVIDRFFKDSPEGDTTQEEAIKAPQKKKLLDKVVERFASKK
ncbi:MAG: serine hydrolase [Ruminococcaceae bacterium]|nr:serine hydrolase [Oscillospiraceae bacterium]